MHANNIPPACLQRTAYMSLFFLKLNTNPSAITDVIMDAPRGNLHVYIHENARKNIHGVYTRGEKSIQKR